jgi:hypothetical protein
MSLANAAETPGFDEVYGLLRSNLTGMAEAELEQAVIKGLLQQLGPRVNLITNASETESAAGGQAGAALTKSTVFDQSFGYLRVARVGAGLAAAVNEALAKLNATNRLQGLALDLRYADGFDYAEAVKVADQFIAEERPLLSWGETKARSSAKTNAFGHPVTVLINGQTAGAAEALAAMLREAKAGLIIGGPSAGQASLFKEFALRTGHRLRIATTPVHLADGQAIPATGLTPDILVAVSAEDEKQYYADAYRVIAKPVPRSLPSRGGTNQTSTATNRASRLNEADLVRMKREGLDPESVVSGSDRVTAPPKPVVTDPALARALDLLKGLAVVQGTRRS